MPDSWQQANRDHKAAHHELLTLTASSDRCLRTVWLNPFDNQLSVAEMEITQGCFPSLAVNLPETAWDEREIHDLFGWTPTGHPDLRPLIRTPRWPETYFPLRKSQQTPQWLEVEPDLPSLKVEGDGVTIMKVGPTHAGIIESGHFIFSLIGENILHLDAHLFQNHRGVEALLEDTTVNEVAPLVTRICAADTVSNQTNWASAVERLAGFTPAPRTVLQRIILLEAERILSHLNDLAQIPAGVGFQVAHQRALALKESWQRSLEFLYGHRFLFDTVHPGWTRSAPADLLLNSLANLRRHWVPWRQLVVGHHGFADRMGGIGQTTLAQIDRFGAQGVAARAAGKTFDARQSTAYYEGFFTGPVTRSAGDVQARFDVRLDEVEASMQIIESAAGQLEIESPTEPEFLAPKDLSGRIVTFTESPHGLNSHDVTLSNGNVFRYHIRSAPFRNWPLLAQTVAGNAVADFPLINKSFELCYSCTDR